MTSTFNNSVVLTGDQSLNRLPEILNSLKGIFSIYVLMDTNTDHYCFDHLNAVLHKHYRIYKLVIEPGEFSKTMDVSMKIWNKLLLYGADKNDILISLGGGVISDIGGFVASVYKRGIKFINIPTTLMGMTDASLGGKNGIDFNDIKNIIGTISFPLATIVDTRFLNTLNDRELKNGWAEIFKHALIADADLWELLPSNFERNNLNSEILQRSIKIKLDIVEKDPNEKGLRKILNFGHTIGHAVESSLLKENVDSITHGEAVVAGMIMEIMLAVKYVKFDQLVANNVVNKLVNYFGKISLSHNHLNSVLEFIAHDKKSKEGMLNFVLINKIGSAIHDIVVDKKDINDIYNVYIGL